MIYYKVVDGKTVVKKGGKNMNAKQVKVNILYEGIGPTVSGIATVGEHRMDFVVHNNRLILSDPNASEETVKAVGQAFKELTANVFKAENI